MTASVVERTYTCPDCGEVFSSQQRYGGHVHARHPERRRPLPKFLQAAPAPTPRRGPSLKRPTDTWPAKP